MGRVLNNKPTLPSTLNPPPPLDMSRQGFEPPISCTAGEHYTKELLWQLLLFAIQNLNIHRLIPGRENKLKCGIIGN